MAVGVLVAPELYDGQDEHAWREVYQFYGLLTGQDDWAADVTLKGYLFADGGARINGLEVTGDLRVHGSTWLGDNAVHTLIVAATSTFNAGVAINANATIGDNASRAITVNGTTTFNANVTDNNDLTVKGNTTLGDAASDALVANATASFRADVGFRNAAGTTAPMYVDAATPRVYIGNNSPSGGTAGQVLDVSGGRSYFSANGEAYAVGVKNTRAQAACYIGASNSATPDLILSNMSGTQTARVTHAGVLIVGGSTGPVGSEKLRIDGTLRLDAGNGVMLVAVGVLTAAAAAPGSAGAVPANPATYFYVSINGSSYRVPAFN